MIVIKPSKFFNSSWLYIIPFLKASELAHDMNSYEFPITSHLGPSIRDFFNDSHTLELLLKVFHG